MVRTGSSHIAVQTAASCVTFTYHVADVDGTRIRQERMMKRVKDLVCGMTIEPQTAAATSQYGGKTYYFCAPGCKVAFDRNPEEYISGHKEPEHGG